MKVGEIMTLEVEYVGPQDNVQRAAELMRDLDVGLTPVVDGTRVVGVVTDRDIAVRFVAEGLDFSGTSVADVMSREVHFAYEDQDVEEATRLMESRGVRRLIVLDRDNHLVGVVTRGDVARGAVGRSGGRGAAATQTAQAVNALIKDELAAVESYRQAVGRLRGPAMPELRRLENEHEKAAALLQQALAERGVEPPLTAGAWGVWSRVVEGAAAAFGEKAALEALKLGEESGVREYEHALQDAALPSDVRSLIQTELLPHAREHLPALDTFLRGRGPRGTSYNADQGYGPSGGGRGVA